MLSRSERISVRTLKQTKGEIIEWLQMKDDEVSTLLIEDTGVGKSWMAKEMSECTTNWGSCYATLWVYVTEKYDINLFYKDIARQLCVITEEWEYEDKKTVSNLMPGEEFIQFGHTDEKADQAEEMTPKEREESYRKLNKIGNTMSAEGKYLLLVLDDVGNDSISSAVLRLQVELSEVWRNKLFPSKFQNRLKIIITTKFVAHIEVIHFRDLQQGELPQLFKVIQFPRYLQEEELSQFLLERVNKKVSHSQIFRRLDRRIAEKSEGEPVAIIVIAETLNYIARAVHASKLESAILRAAHNEKTFNEVNPLIYCACDMIKKSVTRNCFWHGMQLFRNYGGIHYNELICHWIMEGYFDPVDQIEEAYRKGHDVLMELIDRALLMIQDNNIVTAEEAVLKMIDSCPLTATLSLRLFNVLKDDESLGKVTRMNGMLKTLCNPKFWERNSTLLVDSSHISGGVHQSIFNSMRELKVLAVFKARCDQTLILSLSKMEKLLVLVLRTCDLLDDIADIKELKTLKVLEISGDSRLSSFPDKLFDGMTELQSLNLSGLQIKSLPSLSNLTHLQSLNLSGVQIKSLPSLSNLRELRFLILGQLSCLEEVQSLKELVNLEILDLSGASSLKSMPSDLFDETTNLQSLDLSELQIESLPSLSKLTELRVLILRRCSRLKKLQSLRGLGKLELLDISDANSFESFDDPSLSVLPKIRKISLCNTNVQSLPEFDELKELTQIFLSGCRNLSHLPKLQLLTSLQILDLSGASIFRTFEDQSLKNLDQLRVLDLSRTSISVVPEIPINLLELNLMPRKPQDN